VVASRLDRHQAVQARTNIVTELLAIIAARLMRQVFAKPNPKYVHNNMTPSVVVTGKLIQMNVWQML